MIEQLKRKKSPTESHKHFPRVTETQFIAWGDFSVGETSGERLLTFSFPPHPTPLPIFSEQEAGNVNKPRSHPYSYDEASRSRRFLTLSLHGRHTWQEEN